MDDEELASYVKNAIRRYQTRELTGSHAAGVFGKAASQFEKKIQLFLRGLLEYCGLDYEKDVRPVINGPKFDKLTLGNCLAALQQAAHLQPGRASGFLPRGRNIEELCDLVSGINKVWVELKHGTEIAIPRQVDGLEAMLNVLHLLRER